MNSKHACENLRTSGTTLRNAQIPAIAYVNSESRQIALEQGRQLEPADVRLIKSIWVQPHRDVLHLNWSRLCYASWGVDVDYEAWVDEFLLQAKNLGMRPSITAALIHYFSLKAVLDYAGDANLLRRYEHCDQGIFDIPKIHYHRRGEGIDDVREMVDILPWAKGQCSMLDIAMVGVTLHITREVALRSGLFGLLGDAPVQMVDVDDEARLREYHALFREHALETEPVVETLFETFTSPLFKMAVETSKRKAEWIIYAYMWQSARDRKMDILGPIPGSAWLPYLPEQK
ncbi:uncharacterized protein N7515_000639 [Penicillium bovifimosum]|uniref:Uncharacterized protein n=1 Tax=Penicillium bovifimosum TaxID=126998 RepID=A0A9W9HFS3_9EURO|nr:uncharacterized protein N7515_000639 [Penicillium bovifimosum]KAJ5146075.1 hypothetical protein N7515_000639 [Penicillium bovifimosum]